MSDGTPYGPSRYKEIVLECYRISGRIHTSYTDVMQITPLERKYILSMLDLEDKKREEELTKIKQSASSKKR